MPSGYHTWSQTAASNGTADDNINYSEGQAPSSVNDSARAMMAVLAKHRDDVAGTLTTGGTSTAYTLTTNTVFSSAAGMNGQTLRVKFHTTNGANATLNTDSQGACELVTSTGVAALTGAIVGGQIYDVTYLHASTEFLLVGVYGALASDTVATGSIQSNAVTDGKLRDSAALSVIGRASNSSGDPADIAAGSDGHVLRRSGTSLGFGTIATAGIADNAVTFGKFATAVKASASDQETGSSGTTFVSPDVQHRHQSAAKAWGVFAGSTGTLLSGYNCSGVVRTNNGEYDVSFGSNLSSDQFIVVATPNDTGNQGTIRTESQTTGGFHIQTKTVAGSVWDPGRISFIVYGDL